jgi:hypothetical protein
MRVWSRVRPAQYRCVSAADSGLEARPFKRFTEGRFGPGGDGGDISGVFVGVAARRCGLRRHLRRRAHDQRAALLCLPSPRPGLDTQPAPGLPGPQPGAVAPPMGHERHGKEPGHRACPSNRRCCPHRVVRLSHGPEIARSSRGRRFWRSLGLRERRY